MIGRLGTVLGALACTFVAMTPATVTPVAAQPARVQGLDCGVLAAQGKKIWQTSFWGWKIDEFGFRQELNASPCFTSEANCKAWLYWARADFDPN